MKFLIAILVLATSQFAMADVVDSCKLTSMSPEDMTIEGTFEVVRHVGEKAVLHAKATITEPEEEPTIVDGEDTISFTKVYTGSELQELITKDDVAQELVRRLGDETLTEFTTYQGKNFEDDGAGLVLMRAKGEKGTMKGVAFIGWGAAYCD